MIPRKLYARLTDLAEELYHHRHAPDEVYRPLDHALEDLMDEVHWPWKASHEQIDDWNSKQL